MSGDREGSARTSSALPRALREIVTASYALQEPQPPGPHDPQPGPVGFEHGPLSAQPPCFTPLPFGSS